MATRPFDDTILGTTEQALDFIGNIIESSTEYSIIGTDIDGGILLWNEGARRLYGYEPEDVKAGRHQEIAQAALRVGKWERRENGAGNGI